MNGGRHRLQQDSKAFLHEMIVMRQDFADAFGPHRLHRDAIRQAVTLVWAGFVEGETIQEGLMRLRADDDAGVAQNPFGIADGSLTYRASLAAEMSEKLGQDFFRSDDRRPA